MTVELVRIGNSRGVRIPKALIEQCRLGNLVDLHVEADRLIISPAQHPRAGWGDAFARAICDEPEEQSGLESTVIADHPFDLEEWTWE